MRKRDSGRVLAALLPPLLLCMATTAQAGDAKPAREIFGALNEPAPIKARSIGGYAKGCLAGAKMLPVNGPAWQAMRLSRNRNWGHPALVALVEKLAVDAKRKDGWPGLLVGDLAQPWGGPMLTGHASHQIGLDADIWLLPMPDRLLTEKEREELSAVSMLKPDMQSVDPERWTPKHAALIKRAASYKEVARIFIHPAIKKALCESAGSDRRWLSKVRPWWGHHYHFHVRLSCPPDSPTCVDQPPTGNDDGCGKELDRWMKKIKPRPKPKVVKPAKPKRPLTLADLPKECRELVTNAEQKLIEAKGKAPDPGAQVRPAALAAPQNAEEEGSDD